MKSRYDFILWDFDGTVMDSCRGIMDSVKYAAGCLGVDDPGQEVLRTFIGPPLRESFPRAFGFDEKTTEEAIDKYRQYYGAGAMYSCSLYDGVKEAVSRFRQNGILQYIATSKPEHACRSILERKGLEGLFDGVFGATDDGRIDTKKQVIEEAFRVLEITDKSRVVLIGDTRYDVIGAKEAGIECIGVTYGAGSRKSLEENGAIAVFDTMPEVCAYIFNNEE